MNKIIVGLAIFVNMAFLPVKADPVIKEWKTLDSMGCMMLEECCLLYTSDAADE